MGCGSGRNPNPRKSGLPPKYLGGVASDYPGLPRIAPDCPGLPRIAPDCLVLPRFAPDCPVLPRIAPFCPGLPRFASDCPVWRLASDRMDDGWLHLDLLTIGRYLTIPIVLTSWQWPRLPCRLLGPSSADRRPWCQPEQQRPYMYVQGL
jgi:hypothetical protein